MGLIDKLKLGKHYRMERFSLFFFVMVGALALVTVGCFLKHTESNEIQLSDQAVYSTAFTTSRTDVSGDVVGVYTSSDDTKTFVLLQFDDTDSMSLNASNYQMFMTAVDLNQNQIELSGSPSGSIYMFGSTGYMGIYLVNQSGFTSQILDLVVRCNVELLSSTVDPDEDTDDGSFVTYDQFRIYFNPAGSEAGTLECLEGDSAPTMAQLYYEMVIAPQEEEVHTSLTELIEELRVALVQISEYEERVLSEGITIPTQPSFIMGDEVVELEDGTYEYVPATILSGGWDLDWENTTVFDGFLADLIAETGITMSEDDYLDMMYELQDEDSSGNIKYEDYEWRLNDGTLIDDLSGTNSSRYTTYVSLINNLITAWNTYYDLKAEYQYDLMNELLILEFDSEYILNSATINTDSGVLLCY